MNISVRRSVEPAGFVDVAVSDNGPGIPAELLPKIFERFVKEPGSSVLAQFQ